MATEQTSPPHPYTTDSVTSTDGTIIGYRQFGQGPGLVLVHGGMQAAQRFMKLATALADSFTVYVPDRRGRGLSGPHGDHYGMSTECADLEALLRKTGAHNVFGLSAGALIALQAGLTLPAIHKVALYEPPLLVPGYPSPRHWVARYERDLARGDLAAAMVSVMKGTGDTNLFTRAPRVLLRLLMKLALQAEARQVKDGDVPLRTLIPTMHYDAQLTQDMEGSLARFAAMRAAVLLLGGSKSRD